MKGITWEFSPKAIQVLRQYLERFPDIRRLARKAAGRGHVFLDEVSAAIGHNSSPFLHS